MLSACLGYKVGDRPQDLEGSGATSDSPFVVDRTYTSLPGLVSSAAMGPGIATILSPCIKIGLFGTAVLRVSVFALLHQSARGADLRRDKQALQRCVRVGSWHQTQTGSMKGCATTIPQRTWLWSATLHGSVSFSGRDP